MPAAQIGIGGRFAIGDETTFGTEASRDKTAVIKSCTLHAKATNAPVDHLYGYVAGQVDVVQTAVDVEGAVVMPACYLNNVIGIFLKAAMGAVAESGSGPYVHTFTFAEALTAWSGAHTRGSAGGSAGVTEEFYGLTCAKFVLKLDARTGTGEITTDWRGKSAGTRAAASPSLPALATSRSFVLPHHVGQLTFNSNAHTLKMLTLTIDNNVDMIEEFGSLYVTEAVRAGFVRVTIDVEAVKRDDNFYNEHLARTLSSVSVSITDGTSTLAIAAPANAFVETHEDGITGPGVTTERVTIRCQSLQSTPAGPLTITLTNADATYDAS